MHGLARRRMSYLPPATALGDESKHSEHKAVLLDLGGRGIRRLLFGECAVHFS